MKDEKSWDLSPLVESTDPDKVKENLDQGVSAIKNFEAKYKGQIINLDAKKVLELFKEMEKEELRREGAFLYARLKYTTNMTEAVARDLNDHVRNANMQIRKSLAFVDLELGQLLKKNPKLIEDPSQIPATPGWLQGPSGNLRELAQFRGNPGCTGELQGQERSVSPEVGVTCRSLLGHV